MNGFDKGLLESGALMRRGYSFLGKNAGKAIALLTALIAVLLTFTDIAMPTVLTDGLTAELCVMLVSAYVIYFSLEDAGERLGKDADGYKERAAALNERISMISGDDIPAFRDFCIRYSREELEYRRLTCLISAGVSKEEFEAGPTPTQSRDTRRAIKRAMRMRAVELTPFTLLGGECRRSGSELTNPEKSKLPMLFIKLIPTAICMAFTVSMMITAKGGLDLAAVISGIVKLSTLPIIAMRGYVQGYNYATETLTSWLETKYKLLDAFIKERASTRLTSTEICDKI